MMQYVVIGVMFLLVSCDADERRNIPSVVENALKEKFPNASGIEWDRSKTAYEAEFDANSREHTIEIDTTGSITRIKIDIKDSMLPRKVRTGVDSIAAGAGLSDIEVLQLGENTYYQIVVKATGRNRKLVVDSEGKIIDDIKYWD